MQIINLFRVSSELSFGWEIILLFQGDHNNLGFGRFSLSLCIERT
jgi:hypothetical protein